MHSWLAVLERSCVVTIAEGMDAVEARATQGSIDVLVIEWSSETLARVRALQPRVRIVHFGETLPDGLVDWVAQGHEVAHAATLDELEEKVLSLWRPRRSLDARHELAGLEVRWTGARRSHRLLDIGCYGLSFAVDAEDEIEPLLPGAQLRDVEIVRDGDVVVSGVTACVRHVAADSAAPLAYRVGCELQTVRSEPTGRATSVTDRALISGLIRGALRSAGVLLQSVDGSPLAVHCTSGQVHSDVGELHLAVPVHDFEQHDIVRGRFELGGTVYRFLGVVTAQQPLTLRLPRSIEACQQRSSSRFRIPAGRPVFVELRSSLWDQPLRKDVRDLSGTGLSFDIAPEHELMPLGAELTDVRLSVGDDTIRLRGQVKNLARVGSSQGLLRCGVAFVAVDDVTRVRMADVVMRARFPEATDGGTVSVDELWQFFLDSHFVYPDKAAALAPMMADVRHTLERLYAQPSRVFKAVVCRKEDKPIGHLSMLRAYQSTFVAQHLAAAPGTLVGAMLNLAAGEYIDQNVDLQFFKAYFRPENKWPQRVFGGFAAKIHDPRLSDFRTFGYVSCPTDKPILGSTDLAVIEARPHDLRVVERYFVQHEQDLVLRSDDLTRAALTLADLGEQYRSLGLERRRRVLVALRDDVPVGFALAELSSVGLNLSELTSAFRIYVLPECADAQSVRRGLLRGVLDLYRAAGRPLAVGLVAQSDLAAFEQLGLPISKRYSSWTCRRELLPRFFEHVNRIFESLDARRRRRELATRAA